MTVTIRRGHPDDAMECGRICHAAFASIANAHNFQPDFPSAEVATISSETRIGETKTFRMLRPQMSSVIESVMACAEL